MHHTQHTFLQRITSADLEVQLMQLNHCDGVLSNYCNPLLGQQISQHKSIFMSRFALALYVGCEFSTFVLNNDF